MSQPNSRKPLQVSAGEKVVGDGPLVVPSYSSKALPRISVSTALEMTAEFIVSPVLISAYDIHYHGVDPSRFQVPLIIIDSGGYEMLVDEEGRRRGGNADHAAFDWSVELYAETLLKIETEVPVIAVSYDNDELPIGKQIDAALAARLPSLGSAFLIKPKRGERLTIDSLQGHVARLGSFDIIGVTEKEAGPSLLERVMFVVHLRALLDEHGIAKPIHVFGALNPFITPLFFLAGADIVDGTTWLRFEFSNYGAQYLQSRAAIADPTSIIEDVEWRIRRANYRRAVDMQIAFQRYLQSGRYDDLSTSAELINAIKKVHEMMQNSSNLVR